MPETLRARDPARKLILSRKKLAIRYKPTTSKVKLNTPFTLHFRTMAGQRTVLAGIGCEQSEH